MALRFSSKDIRFRLPAKRKTSAWIKDAIKREKATLIQIDYIFCSDEFVYGLNKKHLGHDTYTDILTFDHSTPGVRHALEGDIFISIDRVRENAEKFNASFDSELHRVLIHGVLHLLGFDDRTAEQRAVMAQKEELYLSLRP